VLTSPRPPLWGSRPRSTVSAVPLDDPDETCTFGVAEDSSTIEVVVPAGSADLVEDRWPRLGLEPRPTAPTAPSAKRVVVRAGPGGTLMVEVDGQPAPGGWDRVESELALFAAERLADEIAVHAAVIVHEGLAVVVPGASGSGKSRLCVAAHEVGATVLSDEYALVARDGGLVTGWARPVRVRRPTGGVDRLDIATTAAPVPVGLVAVVRYQPGAALDLEALTTAQTAMLLLANTVCARTRPDESLDAALAVARSAPGVTGVRGEASDALPELFARAAAARGEGAA